MTIHFINDPKYQWHVQTLNQKMLSYKGDEVIASQVSDLIEKTDTTKLCKILETFFKSQKNFTSGVVETEQIVIAWVDHIRSWPLFYSLKSDQFILSNDSRSIQSHNTLSEIDEIARLEFSMAGYVTGRQTLYKDLYCLQPGEFLIFLKESNSLSVQRYFSYQPDFSNSQSEIFKKQELGCILDELTVEIMTRANGRKIWVPLSAGLDSRILLCKFHEHGYQNIETFTYGPNYNYEAFYAKKIALKLKVPWRQINLSRSNLRNLFESETRKKFWRFADNLKNIPCMREYSAIAYLHDQNIANSGDIFINGQSGDFITGGHIPPICFDQKTVNIDSFLSALIDKHYSLWEALKTYENLQIIREKINFVLGPDWQNNDHSQNRAAQAENWEYDARQICYVVNGQRVYEFFGFDWEMPLWDKRLVDFCSTLSMQEKKGQALFKSYLQNYNYKGLFLDKEPYVWRWPLPMLWVVVAARIIKIFSGSKAKTNFYKFMRYYGHYANQYAFFSLNQHKKHYQNARNEVSMYVSLWLEENMNSFKN